MTFSRTPYLLGALLMVMIGMLRHHDENNVVVVVSAASASSMHHHHHRPIKLNRRQLVLMTRGGAEEVSDENNNNNDKDDEEAESNNKAKNDSKGVDKDEETSSVPAEDAKIQDSSIKEAISQVESSDNEEGEGDNEEVTTTVSKISSNSASDLRLQGKQLHDEGNFLEAANMFGQAADALQGTASTGTDGEDNEDDDSSSSSIEYSTCRLHQALCFLKVEQWQDCIDACTQVLDETERHHQQETPAAIRARAHHRRAKAYQAMGDTSSALQDARAAAFLGDRKAVALYGKLMRNDNSAGGSSSSLSDLLGGGTGTGRGSAGDLDMGSLFAGLDTPPSSGSSSSSTNALLESLLSKSSPDGKSSSSSSSFNPLSLLLNKGGSGSKDNNSMAKSVIKSLAKKLDDESTQDKISGFLQKTNKDQLKQYTTMAGLPISDDQLGKIESLCHKVTPKTVRKVVKRSKVVIWFAQLMRKLFKVLDKYKSVFVALMLIQWTKSAVNRPMPVNKKAAKRALKQAMKANRAAAKKTKK
jgi:tetratricopeptide (TPR) repeat protein